MLKMTITVASLVAGCALLNPSGALAQGGVVNSPYPVLHEGAAGHREVATFAGGCFWGVQGVFDHVKGVVSTTVGYTGGAAGTARYDDVSTGTTGHAEAVRVIFDPAQVDYADLLRIYFSVITNPTEINRQGPDTGTQYRTALFPANLAQAKVARAYISQLSASHVYDRPIATRLEAQHVFFLAEAHHQKFMARNPDYPYIVYNDQPKVAAFKAMFPLKWKS